MWTKTCEATILLGSRPVKISPKLALVFLVLQAAYFVCATHSAVLLRTRLDLVGVLPVVGIAPVLDVAGTKLQVGNCGVDIAEFCTHQGLFCNSKMACTVGFPVVVDVRDNAQIC